MYTLKIKSEKIMKTSLFLFLTFLSFNALSTPPNYYQMDASKRLHYVNYDALMTQCMKSTVAAGVQPGSSGWNAMQASCNKVLDQVRDPETFEGKIPGQDQMVTKQGIGVELYDAITR